MTKLNDLAIIIPAFKGIYLRDALNSLASQQDKRFRVYVGDDASPEDLRSICGNYKDCLDLHYHRFEHNLGGSALAKHWNRCIALSNEQWLWLFSDDDIADASCSTAFRQALEFTNASFDVYHFQVNILNQSFLCSQRFLCLQQLSTCFGEQYLLQRQSLLLLLP